MANLLKVVYSERVRPFNDYPLKLIRHLFKRFKMKQVVIILESDFRQGDFLRVFKKLGMNIIEFDRRQDCKELMLVGCAQKYYINF